MRARSFASLAFKLLGMYLLGEAVAGLRVIPTALYSFPRSLTGLTASTYKIMLLLPLVPAFVFGVILIAKSNVFAQWAVSTEGQDEEVVLTGKATQSLAFSVIGVVFVMFGASMLMSVITLFMTTRTVQSVMFRSVVPSPAIWPQLIEGLAELAMGAFLFFGGESLSRLWHRIQAPRIPPLSEEPKS